MRQKYLVKAEADEQGFSRVDLQAIVSIAIILGVGLLIALIIFIIELSSHLSTKDFKIFKRSRNLKRPKKLRINGKCFYL